MSQVRFSDWRRPGPWLTQRGDQECLF